MDQKGIVKGENYRITVLTPSLLRLEYSSEGYFEDRATQAVVNRDFETPRFETAWALEGPKPTERGEPKGAKPAERGESKGPQLVETQAGKEAGDGGTPWLILETDELVLYYNQKEFTADGLMIDVKSVEGSRWRYGQEPGDLKGTYRTLDGMDGERYIYVKDPADCGKIELGTGLLSREGFSVIDDGASMPMTEDGWVEQRRACIDLYFWGYGHRYLECLKDFYHLCGRTPLLPRYALGNWWSRYHRYSADEYKELMLRFEAERLPFSVAVLDMDWHLVDEVDPKYGSGWTGYTWNRELFPDPEEFLAWLHDRNLKVSLNVHPADGVRAYEELYPEMAKALKIDPAGGQTVEFDPSDRNFMKVYFEVLCHSLERQGVDFWWLDWQQGTKCRLPGLDPLWILNHAHYLDSSWKGTRRITFSRYAEVGSHRYPVGFSGDTVISWESLAYQPYFTSTASNIGYGWWSHDIGGHMRGVRDDELVARWVQFGVFSPIMRLHSTKGPFYGREPWKHDAATREVMGRYLRLRHSLIPYLYTMNYRASAEDQPLIWPMYYKEPEREEAYQVPNEYYFGTELLAAPITRPMEKEARAAWTDVWLPEGKWMDFFDGRIYDGGRMLRMWRGIENIPVLMKAGAIVPMTDMKRYSNSAENPAAMEVRIFPAADGRFLLREDDGDSPEDRPENWAVTELALKAGDIRTFTIAPARGNLSVLPEKRSWKLVLGGVRNAAPEVLSEGRMMEDVVCSYQRESHTLTVELKEFPVTRGVTVVFPQGEPLIAENDVDAFCGRILNRAQTEYALKNQIWSVLEEKNGGPEGAADKLNGIDMPEGLRGSLLEVLRMTLPKGE